MSYTAKLRAEELVREKDQLEKERSQIEGWLAHMRITMHPLEDRTTSKIRHLFWRGWGRKGDDPTPVPHAVCDAFYDFLIDRRDARYKRVREIQDELASAWKGDS